MRAIWKGYIQFSLVTIPVRIYNAFEPSETISFRQLHQKDHGAIGYDKKCKLCHQSVSNDEIVKGYEYEPDQYVIINPDDLEKVKLKTTRIIEIEGFVEASEVDPMLYDTPYFAGPDGEVASKAYSLLCQTLKDTGKMGIGRVVLRERESVMMVAPQENGLVLYKLRYPDELRKMNSVPLLNGMQADKNQLKLAHTLVDTMSKHFEEFELKDRYKEAIREMVVAKIEGKEIVTMVEEEKPVVDIMTALKQSIEQAKTEKKPMKKVTEKKSKSAKEAKASKSSKRKTG